MLTVLPLLFNPIQENTYLVYNEKGEAAIIDPGCYFSEEKEKLKLQVASLGLTPTILLNTHCHLDHVFGNRYVGETWGLELHFHEAEQKVFEYAPKAGELWNMPFQNYEGPVHYVKENDIISIGDNRLKVLFTPGHSPGSVSYYCEEGGWVISGDLLFKGSVGRTDLPGADFATLEHSIQTRLYVLPDAIQVYSGHGAPTTIGFEKSHNPFVQAN